MNANAAADYKTETKRIYDQCRGNDTEYDTIDEEGFAGYLRTRYGIEPSSLQKRVRDEAQLIYLLHQHEKLRGNKGLGAEIFLEELRNLLSRAMNSHDEDANRERWLELLCDLP